jgi:hypothetical protein
VRDLLAKHGFVDAGDDDDNHQQQHLNDPGSELIIISSSSDDVSVTSSSLTSPPVSSSDDFSTTTSTSTSSSSSHHPAVRLKRVETLSNGARVLRIGSTVAPVAVAQNAALVPDVLFFDMPKHVALLEDMLKDLLLGEHLLLIGNQGVGKNKLSDHLLQLLQREREYIQLHRDTTVQSLTLLPSLQGGVVVYEDSPLVKAMSHGRVLVVDEFDKVSSSNSSHLPTRLSTYPSIYPLTHL